MSGAPDTKRCTYSASRCMEPGTVEIWKRGTLLHILCERHAEQVTAAGAAFERRRDRRDQQAAVEAAQR